MMHFYTGIYYFIFLTFKCSCSDVIVNAAPAKITLRLHVSKLTQSWTNESSLKLCVDKRNEKCFWTLNENIVWTGEQFNEIVLSFSIANMATPLTIEVLIEHANKKIDFPKKAVNLMSLSSKSRLSIDSFNLESLVTVSIEHECENGYYPPKQCTKACHPMPNESVCDGFGNRKCKDGLLYNAKIDRCIANVCMKSNVRCQNGLCINDALTFKCECFDDYFGKFCQFRNLCSPNPCYNGGKCTTTQYNQSFTCSCTPHFTGNRCQARVTKKCPCPENMTCNYSENGILESCTPEIVERKRTGYVPANDFQDKNKLKVGGLEPKKYNELIPVSMTTTIIAVVGCLMIILCIGVSVYIFCLTREQKKIKRDDRTDISPSTLYTDFSPKLNETSFKRSFSLEDNSAYMPANSQILQVLPNHFTMGSSTGYSLHSNSYQDNLPTLFRGYPLQNNFVYQPEYPITPLILHPGGYTRASSISTASAGSSQPIPPMLPPRSNNTETTSPETLQESE